MKTQSTLKAVLGVLAGLGLAFATVAYAQDGHMGNYNQSGGMMGQPTQKATTDHGGMMGQPTTPQATTDHHGSVTTEHHANTNQKSNDYPCHGDTKTKS